MQKLSSADNLTKFNQIPVADSGQTQFKLNAPPNCARDRFKKTVNHSQTVVVLYCSVMYIRSGQMAVLILTFRKTNSILG